jgi:hypothetical protein
MYCAELENREVEEDEGFGGSGDAAVGKSMVAKLPGLLAGAPQFEQKRPVAGTSVPQDGQMNVTIADPVYSLKNKCA